MRSSKQYAEKLEELEYKKRVAKEELRDILQERTDREHILRIKIRDTTTLIQHNKRLYKIALDREKRQERLNKFKGGIESEEI